MKAFVVRSHKIRLRPTKQQQKCLFRAAAAARHAYNWGKAALDEEYEMGRELYLFNIPVKKKGYPHPVYQLKKLYNQDKPDWVSTNNGTATQEAFADLQKSMVRYWAIQTGKIQVPKPKKPRGDGKPLGWPHFRSRRKNVSFRCTNVAVKVVNKTVTYNAKEVGPIRMCEAVRFPGKLMNVTFSWDGFYWQAAFQVQTKVDIPENNGKIVGVDLGIKYLAVTSDDSPPYENPKPLKYYTAKMTRLQKKYSRSLRLNNPDCYDENGKPIKGKHPEKSNRAKTLEQEIKKLHLRIKNIRADASHQITAAITAEYGNVVLEDLNISGMLKNSKLSKAVSDAALFEKRRQFEYKSQLNGGQVVLVDRWYPSSKTCNSCGWVNAELTLSDREWICLDCGVVNERDLNAAQNLRDEGLRILQDRREVPR